MDKHLRTYLAEMIGTFAFVFVSAGAVCAVNFWEPPQTKLVQTLYIALAEGLTLTVALAITLPYHGGYLNPAVTLMLWVYKRLDGAKTTGLIFAQLLGAALAGGLLRLVIQNDLVLRAASMGTPHVSSEIASVFRWSALFSGGITELCLTMILTAVIFGTLIDPRAPKLLGPVGQWLAPLWVGLTMAVLTLAAYPLTGAAANPARWFGTVIWEYSVPGLSEIANGPHRDLVVYWVGPILGTLLAGGAYTTLLLPDALASESAGSSVATGPKQSAPGSTLFKSKK